jgi:hypothetical protein
LNSSRLLEHRRGEVYDAGSCLHPRPPKRREVTQMNRFAAFLCSLCVAALSPAAFAHHSAAQYDFTKTVTFEGEVKLFEVQNPHTKLVLEVKDKNGTVKDIEFEGHSRNNIYRRGWRPDMVKEGDEITVGVAPRRDGQDGGYVTSYTLKDGTEF